MKTALHFNKKFSIIGNLLIERTMGIIHFLKFKFMMHASKQNIIWWNIWFGYVNLWDSMIWICEFMRLLQLQISCLNSVFTSLLQTSIKTIPFIFPTRANNMKMWTKSSDIQTMQELCKLLIKQIRIIHAMENHTVQEFTSIGKSSHTCSSQLFYAFCHHPNHRDNIIKHVNKLFLIYIQNIIPINNDNKWFWVHKCIFLTHQLITCCLPWNQCWDKSGHIPICDAPTGHIAVRFTPSTQNISLMGNINVSLNWHVQNQCIPIITIHLHNTCMELLNIYQLSYK